MRGGLAALALLPVHKTKHMKLKALLSLTVSVALLGLIVGCASLESQAKISRADAERTALARVPGGTIKEGGLEKEKGKLVWSFDIAKPGDKNITEIHVDALTGAIVSEEIETPEKEAKEKKEKEEKKK